MAKARLSAIGEELKPKSKARSKAAQVADPEPGPVQRMTVKLPPDLIERLRDACYWDRLTLGELIAAGCERELARLEKRRGEAYAPRDGELKRGRRIR